MRPSFSAGACVLALCVLVAPVGARADGETQTVNLRLLGASAAATPSDAATLGIEPYFLAAGDYVGAYDEVHPGIASAGYSDGHQFEYVFRLMTGADPELIETELEGFHVVTMTENENVIHEGDGMDAYQRRPYAVRRTSDGETELTADYELRGDDDVGLVLHDDSLEDEDPLNGHTFNLVPAGGEPGGPHYDYYMSKFEFTNDELVRFLNDAEGATNNARGANMYFDDDGDVYFNSAKRRNRQEIFRISQSRLVYSPTRAIGRRYRHYMDENGAEPYVRHPASGISWVGAVKYCNWLTVHSGRGEAERCYTEGTNVLDWAPVTATNWSNGRFGEAERRIWLGAKGFRLPMLDCDPYHIVTNRFDEFYKAAVWNSKTNVNYGFGRSKFMGVSANAIDTVNRHSAETMPVGYFNGENSLDEIRTKRNENYYNIYDLSGNVSEWCTDFGREGSTATRAVCGGSWAHRMKPVNVGEVASPVATSSFAGFRVVTTYMPEDNRYVHLLFCFHYRSGAAVLKVSEVPVVAAAEHKDPEDLGLKGLEAKGFGEEIPGVLYRPQSNFIPTVVSVPEASPFAP